MDMGGMQRGGKVTAMVMGGTQRESKVTAMDKVDTWGEGKVTAMVMGGTQREGKVTAMDKVDTWGEGKVTAMHWSKTFYRPNNGIHNSNTWSEKKILHRAKKVAGNFNIEQWSPAAMSTDDSHSVQMNSSVALPSNNQTPYIHYRSIILLNICHQISNV